MSLWVNTAELELLRTTRSNTYKHSLGVMQTATKLYDVLSPDFSKDAIINGAMYHDVGKLRIDDDVLMQKAHLTPDERKQIERHPLDGFSMMYEFFGQFPEGDIILDCILYHHQYMNKTGYPYRLAGEEVPFAPRIITVADHFDAMTHRIRYDEKGNKQTPMSIEQAVENMKSHQEIYDADVFAAFLQIIHP